MVTNQKNKKKSDGTRRRFPPLKHFETHGQSGAQSISVTRQASASCHRTRRKLQMHALRAAMSCVPFLFSLGKEEDKKQNCRGPISRLSPAPQVLVGAVYLPFL
jgi:hypothetical protein